MVGSTGESSELVKIQDMIYEIRGQKVMLDRDLAELYGVELRSLNQAVKRNLERFPDDFMFQLTQGEWDTLRSHFVIANRNISKVRFTPYAFTEQGVAMLASVLSSQKAISVNIQIMRAFIQLRNYVLANGALHEQVGDLRKLLMLHMENTGSKFSEHDEKIRQIVHALNNLAEQPKKTKTIGFRTD